MPITRIKVENFRSVRSVTLVLGTHMILIGPNNAGKTAILDALHFALKGGQNRKRLTFRPSDIHLRSDEDDPKTVPGVSIEVHADVVEDEPWSKRLMADMKDVVQLGLASASRRISLRVRYGWNEADSEFEFVPEFLGADGNAISISRSMAFRYRQRFCRQFPVFYLSALRDVSHEFDNRSEFWHALLRAMEIPSELEVDVAVRLRKINDDLLESDKRLEAISQTLAEAARIASSKGSGDADLEIDGLNARELLARTGIRLRAVEQAPWIPIRQQGQGVQSLSVLFLFKAFVYHVLSTVPFESPQPILLLEEPETHLHPQAARSIWNYIKKEVPGRKLITSHSTHFLQDVSFLDLVS